MTTKYIVKIQSYDMFGENWDWVACTGYTTIEECEKKTATLDIKQDYIIEARTIDEENFAVTDERVKEYDYYNEIGRYEKAPYEIRSLKAEIAEYEKRKQKCKTAEGKANNDKQIARCNEEIEYWEGLLRERA